MTHGYSLEEAVDLPNLRKTKITYKGKSYSSMSDLCKEKGLSCDTVEARLKRGWTLEDAVETPIGHNNFITYKGKTYKSLKALCEELGLDRDIIKDRMLYHHSLDKAIEMGDKIPNGKPIMYKGIQYKSIRKLCKEKNKDYKLVHSRLKNGYTIEEAICSDNLHHKPVIINGVEYSSISEACRAYKTPASRAISRLQIGWSVEEAVTIPRNMYIGEYRVAECLKRLNVKFYHDCSIKTVFKDLELSIDWDGFLNKLQSRLSFAGYNWSKQKIQKLRPDFVLYTDEDNKIRGVIEFDGEQHQNFMEFFFKTIEEFYKRSNTDFVKQSFWEYLNIPMLRIRHDQIDMIDDMVTDFINNPQKYIHNHNTYLSESEYWSILTEQKAQLEIAFAV